MARAAGVGGAGVPEAETCGSVWVARKSKGEERRRRKT